MVDKTIKRVDKTTTIKQQQCNKKYETKRVDETTTMKQKRNMKQKRVNERRATKQKQNISEKGSMKISR